MKPGIECIAFGTADHYFAYSVEHPIHAVSDSSLIEAQQALERRVTAEIRAVSLGYTTTQLHQSRPLRHRIGLKAAAILTPVLSASGIADHAYWSIPTTPLRRR